MTKITTQAKTMKEGTRFDDPPTLTTKRTTYFVCDGCGLSLDDDDKVAHTFEYLGPEAGSDVDPLVHLCKDCFADGPGSALSFATLAQVRDEEYYDQPMMIGDSIADIKGSYRRFRRLRNAGFLGAIVMLWVYPWFPVGVSLVFGGMIALFGAIAWQFADSHRAWLNDE